jgi:hypothetical protein
MANLIRVVVLILASLVLLLSSVFVVGPDGVRSYDVLGIVIDVVAVLVIFGVAWSWRATRARTR